ncbi:Zn-dependent hydrolase [Acuticoccus sp. M5D2P5]|uniref:Zn-dependent hydrolase n=1 Tax=Acuticoccus kalidii TaxID=2910977 RepID=UPI001F2C13D2|nr:Zn-dependent hydrolase [Acuticoccus kalidii]MCF3933123.1 Zn-dependent hydrolase [Acuticoccus kalidii]
MTHIDGDRLWQTLMRSAEIGPGLWGGLKRLALTAEDGAMRDQLRAWGDAAGLATTIDQSGNMFLRLDGATEAPPILVGSHLDTQVAGGRFDGVLGVLAGLEILRTLRDRGHVPARPIEVVNWTNEEGARFSPPMMASAVFAGVHPIEWLHGRVDDDGIVLRDALEAIGYLGAAPVGKPVDAYFELHIEQGPALWDEGNTVGLVTGGFAVEGLVVRFRGETAHTGPTPMAQRRNALVGAARVAALVDEIGHRYAPIGKATVARLTAWPNKPGILSDFAELTLDVRHADKAVSARMLEEVMHAIAEGARRARVEPEIVNRWTYGDERFDPSLVALLRTAAARQGVPAKEMKSEAGHDAYYLSRVAPTAMLLSPTIDGISHNEGEDVPRAETIAAANVLFEAVLSRADRT